MVTINLDYWKSLSQGQQEAVLKAAAEIEAQQWKASEARTISASKEIATNGMQVTTEEEVALAKALDEAAGKIVAAYLKRADAKTKAVLSTATD
jgi:TRAP-type C4-dicarboxylate transport system substrate-binding protein